jgi:chorismate mutase
MRARRTHAIRGATTVDADRAADVVAATRELLECMAARNGVVEDDVVSVIFTVTPDLASAFPAGAARALGWSEAPLLCSTEIPVPGALPRCVRVLMHVEFAEPRCGVAHAYLRDAVSLRPEWAAEAVPAAARPVPAALAPSYQAPRAARERRRAHAHHD